MPPRLSRRPANVREFFDRAATRYDERFSSRRPYQAWLFRERFRLATDGLALTGKTVLDVGAGTGRLYRYLREKQPDVEYFATDISPAMLEQSSIPPARRFAGRLDELDLPAAFDFVFVIGVTSYMDQPELLETLRFIAGRLNPGGTAVLTFTHRRSLEWRLLRPARPLIRRLRLSRGVTGQAFTTAAYSPREVERLLPDGLRITRHTWFNPLVPPLDRLFPRLWKSIAHRLQPRQAGPTWLYADFMIHSVKAETNNH